MDVEEQKEQNGIHEDSAQPEKRITPNNQTKELVQNGLTNGKYQESTKEQKEFEAKNIIKTEKDKEQTIMIAKSVSSKKEGKEAQQPIRNDESWEEIVSETAGLRAQITINSISTLGRTLPGVTPIAIEKVSRKSISPLSEYRERHLSHNDIRLIRLLNLLTNGEKFKKYKYGKSRSRDIWCTALLDFVLWGDKSRCAVKGALRSAHIRAITLVGNSGKRFNVVTPGRTLELEASSPQSAKAWVEAFEFLKASVEMEKQKRLSLLKLDSFCLDLEKCRVEHYKLLITGDVFKKWPSRKVIQPGSLTIRKIWCDEKLQHLHWTEISSNFTKGSLALDQLVQVIEDDQDETGLKFSLVCVGRTLDLEAKSNHTKSRWSRALRFLIYDLAYYQLEKMKT